VHLSLILIGIFFVATGVTKAAPESFWNLWGRRGVLCDLRLPFPFDGAMADAGAVVEAESTLLGPSETSLVRLDFDDGDDASLHMAHFQTQSLFDVA